MLTHGEKGDFLHTTWVYLDPAQGDHSRNWRVGENTTVGDWLIWLLAPPHFGTYWGVAVKILWALLGIMLPVLSFTGVLMYRNRYLSKKWSRGTNRQ
ncbi:MAG TPA: PepSY-associated TM helix domain-containing protein [Bryobacteraceae bacterium]|nr:PepSY-associated TM helix domain-containing protein [Bryobacteraceae bacterium]